MLLNAFQSLGRFVTRACSWVASCVSRNTGERADDTEADDSREGDGATKLLKPENPPDYTDPNGDVAVTDRMTDYESIKRKLLLTPGALFEDKDFPASNSSIYLRAPWSSSRVEWKRPRVSVKTCFLFFGCLVGCCPVIVVCQLRCGFFERFVCMRATAALADYRLELCVLCVRGVCVCVCVCAHARVCVHTHAHASACVSVCVCAVSYTHLTLPTSVYV